MKRYTVVFDPHAQDEALKAADYIAQFSPASAAQWFLGLEKAIDSLGAMRRRCSLARESAKLGVHIRHYIYGSYRIIFRIEEQARVVRVLHVRHAAQRTVGEAEES